MGLLDDWHVVISRDVRGRGFWNVDLFDGDSDEPTAFFTTKIGATQDAAVSMAARRWPYATISVRGRCAECDDGMDDDGAQCCACDGNGWIEVAAIVGA